MSRTTAVRTAGDFARWASHGARGVTFAGPDPHYGIGLDAVLPEYGILCLDETPAAALLRAEGIEVLALGDPADDDGSAIEGSSPEGAVPGVADAAAGSDADGAARRDPRGTPALVLAPRALAWLRERARRSAGPLPVLVFKPSHRLEVVARDEGWRLLCAPAALARRWENKVAFRSLAERLGLRQPAGRIVPRRAMDYDTLAAEFGPRLVVQAPYGYAGMQTFDVASANDLARALDGGRSPEWRVTRLVDGVPFSVNACATSGGVAVGAPFLQLTGIEDVTPYRLGSCGQDWAIMPRLDVDTAAIGAVAKTIGAALAADGFRGLFGVDVVQGRDGLVYAIEVNPRLIASIALCTQLELSDGRLPLLARHVLAHLEPDADDAPLDANEPPLRGGQVVIHHVGRRPFVVSAGVRTGAWSLATAASPAGAARPGTQPADDPFAGGEAQPRRGDVMIRSAVRTEAIGADEALVLMPAAGRRIEHGAAYARVQLRGRGAAERSGRLSGDIDALVRAVRGAVGVPATTPPLPSADGDST